jgi:LysM repeat protein
MKKSLTALVVCALLVVLFGQTVWAAPPAGPATCTRVIHVVRWGENLWRISRWYGTTVHAIAHVNGILNPNRIYAGDWLVIPCAYPHHGGHPGPYHPPHGKDPCHPGDDPCHPCDDPCHPCDDPCDDCDDPCPDDNDPCHDGNVPCHDGNVPCGDCGHPGKPGYGHPGKPGYGHPGKPGYGDHGGWQYPHHGGRYYIVRWGDTLSGIAWRFRVNMWAIVRANRIANPNRIYAGQRLYIP